MPSRGLETNAFSLFSTVSHASNFLLHCAKGTAPAPSLCNDAALDAIRTTKNLCLMHGIRLNKVMTGKGVGQTSYFARDLASLALTSLMRFCSCLSCSAWYSAFNLQPPCVSTLFVPFSHKSCNFWLCYDAQQHRQLQSS